MHANIYMHEIIHRTHKQNFCFRCD